MQRHTGNESKTKLGSYIIPAFYTVSSRMHALYMIALTPDLAHFLDRTPLLAELFEEPMLLGKYRSLTVRYLYAAMLKGCIKSAICFSYSSFAVLL